MVAIVNQTEVDLLTALRAYLEGVMPTGLEIIRSEDSRVPEPVEADYVIMTPISRERLSTNVSTVADITAVGEIDAGTFTATAVYAGQLYVGASMFGTDLAAGTQISAFGTATGGAGTYTVTPTQTVAADTFYAGQRAVKQPTRVTVQVDVYGPNSANNAQIISTLLRDVDSCTALAASGVDAQPLYTGEPRQAPFEDAEQQFEFRWSFDLVLQSNIIVTLPQQFADQLKISTVPADVVYSEEIY